MFFCNHSTQYVATYCPEEPTSNWFSGVAFPVLSFLVKKLARFSKVVATATRSVWGVRGAPRCAYVLTRFLQAWRVAFACKGMLYRQYRDRISTMSVVPSRRDDMIDFFATHAAGWLANQASIGISLIQATVLTTM